MKIEILNTAELVAQKAAEIIAAEARAAVAERGRFVMAVSGGRTPWLMLRALATTDMPWPAVQIAQIDERVASLNLWLGAIRWKPWPEDWHGDVRSFSPS